MIISEATRQKLENIHRTQILKIDLDIIATILFSYYLSTIIKKTFFVTFVIVLIISIIIHRILGINTRINEMIFGNLTKK